MSPKSSKFNIEKIKRTISTSDTSTVQMNQYSQFIDNYSNKDLEELSFDKLQEIYDNGLGLLNQYVIVMNSDDYNHSMINQMHGILNKILFVINNKLLEQSSRLVKDQEKIKKNIKESRKTLIELKSDYKSLIPTMLGIFLGVSIISTAVTGIEKISANYVLPFISTIALLGMLMVAFMYSIYHKKPNKLIGKVMTWFTIITIALWIMSWKWDISLQPREIQGEDINRSCYTISNTTINTLQQGELNEEKNV